MEEDEGCRACSMWEGQERYVEALVGEKKGQQLEELVVDGRIMKRVF
jgi:hypothetical protein